MPVYPTLQLVQLGKGMTDWASGYSLQHQRERQMPKGKQTINNVTIMVMIMIQNQ